MPIPVVCDEAGDTLVGLPASPLTLPAAMRPINLSEFDDHDDHPSYVPPRWMVMPAAAEAATALGAPTNYPGISVPVAAELIAVGDEAAEAEDEADVLEEGYSSLLDLNRPPQLRQPYVRIEVPAADFAPVEPVVIFPGQDARSGMRFARPADVPAPQENQTATVQEPLDDAAPGVRRFDAPGTNGVAASANPAAAQDPAEAERALRSALATLQRMSGAA